MRAPRRHKDPTALRSEQEADLGYADRGRVLNPTRSKTQPAGGQQQHPRARTWLRNSATGVLRLTGALRWPGTTGAGRGRKPMKYRQRQGSPSPSRGGCTACEKVHQELLPTSPPALQAPAQLGSASRAEGSLCNHRRQAAAPARARGCAGARLWPGPHEHERLHAHDQLPEARVHPAIPQAEVLLAPRPHLDLRAPPTGPSRPHPR
jgi:hypothetical protein